MMQLPIKLPQDLKEKWPQVKAVIEVARGRKVGSRRSHTSHFYVNSLPVAQEQAARAISEHWRIENRLHWVLDVVFNEDKMKITDQ